MKTICGFCKTEYTLGSVPTCPVQCAVCGHVWNVPVPKRKNSFLVFIAAVCALLSACIFTFVVITKHNSDEIKKNPLIAQVLNVDKIIAEDGSEHIVVNGLVKNRSKNIYGVPDLMIVSLDDKGNVIDRQKFFASATLLEPGDSSKFSHTLAVAVGDVKKINVELIKQ